MDTQIAILKLTNEERSVMIRENSVLRTTLNCTGKVIPILEISIPNFKPWLFCTLGRETVRGAREDSVGAEEETRVY